METEFRGSLPDGAVAARVLDRAGRTHDAECANGEWRVLLDEPYRGGPQAVTYLDAGGSIVCAPLPAGLEPADDATEPCPACGELRWGRAGKTAACRRCGHREAIATFYGPGIGEPVSAEEVERIRARHRVDLGSAMFKVYGVAGAEPEKTGHSVSLGKLTSVSLLCGDVTVESDAEGLFYPAEWRARLALEPTFRSERPPDGSDVAMSVRLNARHRERAARAATATAREQELLVDGEPTRFSTVTADGRFAAAGERDGVAITITAPAAGAPLELSSV